MKSSTAASPVFAGILTTLILVLAGSVLTSLLLHFSSISEASMPYFTYTVNAISLLAGGFLAGKKGGHKGWYFGGITGIAYFAVITLIGYLALDIAPQLSALIYLVLAFIIAALGGIFGVNMSHTS